MPTAGFVLTDSQGNATTVSGSFAVDAPVAGVPYVGSSMQTNGDPSPLESFCGRLLGVRRTYWNLNGGTASGTNLAASIIVARADANAGRIPWLSYKLRTGQTWATAAAGGSDADIDTLNAQLATVPGEAWVCIHHEPEGDGDLTVWTAMQQRLLARLTAPNIRTSTILTAYNVFKSGNPDYAVAAWWPGSMVDIMGFDAYNPYGRADGSTTWYELKTYYDAIAPAAQARGVDWGIAETGLTDAGATRDADWLTRAFDDMKDQPIQPGLALTYWNAVTSPSNGSWPLGTGIKRDKFKAILARSHA